jgi:hypothetical protein
VDKAVGVNETVEVATGCAETEVAVGLATAAEGIMPLAV